MCVCVCVCVSVCVCVYLFHLLFYFFLLHCVAVCNLGKIKIRSIYEKAFKNEFIYFKWQLI